jgi:hypothetical protein
MRIHEVSTKTDIKEFLNIHRSLYKNDPHFISHLNQDIEKVFDDKQNKFYRHGEATRWILKDEQGKTIGRVAAFINKKEKLEQPTGGVGFFECIDNKEAAFLLLDTCKAWLAERDMEAMDGPVNFGEKDKYWGMIIDNFEASPYYCQNYNPAYYVRLFEEYGFEIYYKQLIFKREVAMKMQGKFFDRAARIRNNPKYEIRNIKKNELDKFTEDFREIYNAAWGRREGDKFSGMHKAQAKAIMNSIKPVIDEDLTHFVYHEDKPVAFYISLPEINQIFKHVNGNLNWWGKIKFMYHLKVKKSCKTSFGIAFGIHPSHQGKGLEGAIIDNVRAHIQPTLKYDDIIITWIGDFNPKMIAIIESLGATLYRTMATYRFLFDREKEFERKPIAYSSKKSKNSADASND